MVSEKAVAELRGLSAGWRVKQAECNSCCEPNDYGKCADELDAALDKLMENCDER